MAVDLTPFSGQFPPEVIQAAQAILASKPDQERAFTQDYGGNLARWLNAFQGFWTDPQNTGNVDLSQFGPESALMGALGYNVNPAAPGAAAATASLNTTGGGTPLEAGLLQTALPGLVTDINADAGRRSIANTLSQGVLNGAGAATAQIARTQGGHFDGVAYFNANPDVRSAWDALPNGTTAGTKMQAGQPVTADQFGEQHYLQFGQREGRQPVYVQSAQLAQDFNNANQTVASNIAAGNAATQTQLGALQTATTQLQSNLTGQLAAQATALQQNIAALTANLNTLDASQRANLTQQIAAQQAALEQSITTQRQALQDQVTALGTAATTEAQARRTSLQQEIAGLTAAQAPLNAARTAAADLQATAVNVGLQHTQDQLTADAARGGFVGGSTSQEAALARAGIGARQAAAQAIGGARVQNADDTRSIGVREATGSRSIADALAEAQNGIAGIGATGNAALTGALATGRQGLANAQATGLAGIGNQTALTQAGIGAFGANTTYGNATTGAAQSRTINDALAQGQYGLTATNAQNTLASQQAGNAARATYYDNDYNRTLSAALAPTTIAGNTAGVLTGLDNYATSGLNRSLGTLNWWAAPNSTAPTPGAIAVQPSNTGNSISGLGTGLVGAGMSIGQANNWWRTPTTQPPANSPWQPLD